ncbi:hypothetical protein ACFWN7_02010 [Agromyces sp. NPDC058484]|uniref:hypothetical protein n=1 Tax=Agromyces sp. NPDC058484 TaxID=3346524 RepID=UPI00364E2F20
MSRADDDHLRFLVNAIRWENADVTTQLWERGWSVADPNVPDGEPLEWFWPPTAPVGYGGLPDWSHDTMQSRPHLYGPRQTPWTSPTRITSTRTGWLLEYGRAIAQDPDEPREYSDSAELIAELERIQWWPMDVQEAKRIREQRIASTTAALARDDHYRTALPTEPYASRLNAIRKHTLREQSHADDKAPSMPRQAGDLTAQFLLVDADAWASAVRTARAGGAGWGPNGPEP